MRARKALECLLWLCLGSCGAVGLRWLAYLWALDGGGQVAWWSGLGLLWITWRAFQQLCNQAGLRRSPATGRILVPTYLAGVAALIGTSYLAGSPPTYRSSTPSSERAALEAVGETLAALPGPVSDGKAFPPTPCLFEAPPSERAVSIAAQFVGANPWGRVQNLCVQATSLSLAVAQLRAGLARRALRAGVKVDVLTGQQPLGGSVDWANAYKLRPGLDGVCRAEVCAMPWQLVAGGVFEGAAPISLFPHLLLGSRPDRVAPLLGNASVRGLSEMTRITTRSYLVEPRGESAVVALRRLRPVKGQASRDQVSQAAALAQDYMVRAQIKTGALRYAVEPYSGSVQTSKLSIPRQAGALWSLCAKGADSEALRKTARRLGDFLLSFRRGLPDWEVYTPSTKSKRAHLGYTSLVLLGLTSCARRFGWHWPDQAIARSAKTLLGLQRAGGQFSPWLDTESLAPSREPEPLYAGGQAVLALLSVEQLVRVQPEQFPFAASTLAAAAERAIRFAAERRWQHPLRDYFYLEENWHCLSAAEALRQHRNVAYEQFCLDYVAFKTRFILGPEDGVDPSFEGGFGFGSFLVPNTVAAAGLAEAVGAAMQIAKAQGLTELQRELSEILRQVASFLVRRQWTASACFLCASHSVVGGFSESLHSSQVRIDFVQHAFSALRASEELVQW